MKQAVPKVLPPDWDDWEELTTNDLQIIFDKVKIFRLGPPLMRVGLGLMYLLMAAFVFGYESGMGLFIGFTALFVVAWLLGEWGLKYYMGLLKSDLDKKQKRVEEGELVERIRRTSAAGHTGKGSAHYWKIGEEKFRVEVAYYDMAEAKDKVRVEILPQSGMVFNVQVLQEHSADA